MLRPDGVLGDLVLRGRARDLRTAHDGSGHVLAEASFDMRVAFLDGRRIIQVTTVAVIPALEALVGATAGSGFRARLDQLVPHERDTRSLLYALLDDVPGATLVSNHVLQAAGVRGAGGRPDYRPVPDVCAGFRQGGTVLFQMEHGGRFPLAAGPAAPLLESGDDPLVWHRLDALPPHSMRRLRRLDVLPGEVITVESLFRDSHLAPDGRGTVIHEYEIRAGVAPGTWRVLDAVAVPRVLPWPECPAAADSAGRLVGRDLREACRKVRSDFRGESTCTHLNDQLRSLGDVVAL
ncbi:DUF2889 domain-containing protein [Streptomyces viridiviolaceus]